MGNLVVDDKIVIKQEDQFIFRYDYNISPKDTLSAFYIFDDQPQDFPFEVLTLISWQLAATHRSGADTLRFRRSGRPKYRLGLG